jgi:hypothetical protein
MITEPPFRAAWRTCYVIAMDWEPLTDADLDAMTDVEIAERARSIQKGRVAKKVGEDPMTDEQCQALAAAGQHVRDIQAALQPAEVDRNRLIRRLRCQYPHDRDLVRRMAHCLSYDRSIVSRIINRSGYGETRAGFRV